MLRKVLGIFSLIFILALLTQTETRLLQSNTIFEEQTSEKVDTCDQITAWEQFDEAQTIDGQTVKILQDSNSGPQLFYTVRCSSECEGKPCKGIQRGYLFLMINFDFMAFLEKVTIFVDIRRIHEK
uniref:Uncharacterized protein n=1 Tax=Acrobeloides nanus TaxID=290746 RepID=A0A914ELU4_9BILA